MSDALEEKRKLLKREMLKEHIAKESVSADPLTIDAPPVSKMESFTRGGLQGATLGFADELVGAGEAGADVIAGKAKPSFDELVKAYQKHRDESRSNFKAAEEANPKTYFGGQLAGGIAPVAASGGLGAGIQGAARLGGLAGLGTSNVDLTGSDTVADKLKGAGTDVAIGGATGAALASIPVGISAIKNKTLPGQLFSQELSGNRIVGEEARKKLGDELVENAGAIGKDVEKAMESAARNKTSILEELTKAGKKYDIADIQQALAEGEKNLPTSFTTEGDAARKALQQPFERAKEIGGVKPFETESIKDLVDDSVKLDPKQLDSFRRALGRLGFEKDLKDDQVVALAKRLSGKTAEKLNTEMDPVTGELVPTALGKANAKIQNLIEAQDIFNLGGSAKNELGQERALTPLLQRLDADNTSSDIARSQFKKGIEALKAAEPELGASAEQSAQDIANRYIMAREANRPLTISREGAKRAAMIGSGYVGRGLNAIDEGMGGAPGELGKVLSPMLQSATEESGMLPTMVRSPDIRGAQEKEQKLQFSKMSSQQMLDLAQRLRGKGMDGVATKVQKAAESDDPVQKAQAEFVIKQSPAARRHIESLNTEE